MAKKHDFMIAKHLKKLGITRERVRQLEFQAFLKMSEGPRDVAQLAGTDFRIEAIGVDNQASK